MNNEWISDSNDPRAITLSPPSMHDALDGGLGYDDLLLNPGRAVIVGTGPWGDIKDGDVIDILWGPELEVVASHSYETGENFRPQIKLEATTLSRFGEGFMPLAAQVTLFDSGRTYRTPAVDILVKFSVPGGLDTNPETPHQNESLARPEVVPTPIPDDFAGIEVVISRYTNMAEGDRITVQWHTTTIRRDPLSANEVDKELRIPIDKTIAASAAGAEVAVRYEIHDRVANWSRWSLPNTVSVPPDEDAPPAPWVLETVGDAGTAIDLQALGSRDVGVRVEGHPGRAGDNIVVTWEGVTDLGKLVAYTCPPAPIARPGQTIDVRVPNEKVASLGGGHASVGYALQSEGTPPVKSRLRRLMIEGASRTLSAPVFRESSGGILDPQTTMEGAHVVVEAWDGLDDDDRCYLEWVGTQSNGQPTFYNGALNGTDLGPDRTLVFTVPSSEVIRLAGGSVRVRYAVSLRTHVRYGDDDGVRVEPIAHLWSPWVDLSVASVSAPLSIDSTPVILSGTIVRLESRVTVPPADTFVPRMATGGVPPYRYSASSGAVEVDAATGRVVSLRNGDAVVTVTDAKGATASYPVKVSGVLHFLDLNSNSTFSTAGAQARNRGARLPSLAEWDALRAAYGGAPAMRQDAGWSSQQFDGKNHYVVFPATGAREVRKSYGLGAPLGLAWAWGVIAPTA